MNSRSKSHCFIGAVILVVLITGSCVKNNVQVIWDERYQIARRDYPQITDSLVVSAVSSAAYADLVSKSIDTSCYELRVFADTEVYYADFITLDTMMVGGGAIVVLDRQTLSVLFVTLGQ